MMDQPLQPDRVHPNSEQMATVYRELDSTRTPERCHFCLSAFVFSTYECPDFDVQMGEQDQPLHRFEGAWLACRRCHGLIEADDFSPLLQRACRLRRRNAEDAGLDLTGTAGDRNLAILVTLRGFMIATPSAPWRRDLAALIDGEVWLDRLNPKHSYNIEMDFGDGAAGGIEQYLFGGTPSEIEHQLSTLPASVASRVPRVQITLGFDRYPVRFPRR